MLKKNKKYNGLKSLGSMLSAVTKPILGKRGFVETDIIMRWQEIVGIELAEVTRPQKIIFSRNKRDGGTLHIMTNGGGEALLLQHKEKMIINKINMFFGYKAVEKIRIIQGHFNKVENFEEKTDKVNLDNDENLNLKIKEISKDVLDKDLAEVLESLGKHIIKTKK